MAMLFKQETKAIIESLLFVAIEPLTLSTLSQVLGVAEDDLKLLLEELMEEYNSGTRGIQLIMVGGGYQITTRPQYAPYIEKLYKKRVPSLSHAALETLAIIAYKQPITKNEIELIRGVKVDGVVSTLMERNLIQEVGRKKGPGRPILYGTTTDFLTYFGLKDLSELPQLDELPEEEVE